MSESGEQPGRVWPRLVRVGRRLRARIFRTPVREEVDEEFTFHVEMRVREYLERGMGADDARRAALSRFDDMEQVKAVCRKLALEREERMMWRERFSEVSGDVRVALRMLGKNPGFAALAVITLGVAIGANTAVFSAVKGVLLKPLPYERPDELVTIWTRYLPESGFDIDQFPISPPELLDYRAASRSTAGVAYYLLTARTFGASGQDPVRLRTALVDGRLFELLGVEPALGRWIGSDDDRPGAGVAVLSHELWNAAFGASPDIVGNTVTLNGASVEVLGVMPPGFFFPDPGVQIWTSMGLDEADPGGRASHFLVGLARMGPGATLERVTEEARTIHAGWAQVHAHNVAHFPIFVPLRDTLVGADVRRALWVLLGAVGMVLLIACANVAGLLLARSEARRHEVAVRSALGAGRARLVRQLLTESLVLAGLGAALGLGLAVTGTRALLALHPDALPRSGEIGLDGVVLVFTGAVVVVAALLFGLAPALRVGGDASLTGANALRADGDRGASRFRRGLITAEVALSVVVVIGAGLLVRSTSALARVDSGAETRGILTFDLSLSADAYPTPGEVTSFYQRLTERLAALPGVRAASAGSDLAFQGSNGSRQDFRIEGRPERMQDEPARNAERINVLPGWMELMGIAVREGRTFTAEDRVDGPLVAVVNEALARTYFSGESPLGARLGYFTGSDTIDWMTVVGVVEDVRTAGPRDDPLPQLYVAVPQVPGIFPGSAARTLTVALAMDLEAEFAVPAVRAALAEMDPALPLANLRTMEQVRRRALAGPRFITMLLSTFGAIALLLAAVGIYGVVAYSVARRTREIGVRRAMGAPAGRVAALMVREGTLPAVLGVVLGLVVARAVTGLLEGLLFGVPATDPLTFAVLAAALVGVALLASWIPARRALRVPPTEALRAG